MRILGFGIVFGHFFTEMQPDPTVLAGVEVDAVPIDLPSFAVKPLALVGGCKAAIPKGFGCGEAQSNTIMVSLKKRELRAEIC